MKSNNDIIQSLKVGLAINLEKMGSSLEEFESLLAEGNSEKVAGLIDGLVGKGIGGIGSAMMAAPEIAATLALGVGSIGGATAYATKRHIDDQDKGLMEKQRELQRLQQLTSRLKSDYGMPGAQQ